MIEFEIAVDKIRKGEVLINDIKNLDLLTNLLDEAFNEENILVGHGKCYYRQITYSFDGWVNSSFIPDNRKNFKLSEVLIKKSKNNILKIIKNLINNL